MSRKINLVIRLQSWMDSVPGQTFLNYAYSWGAAIVILGTLFKLTHLPGANLMLFVGMGTEVVVFFLSAFDRPFDKSEHGRELPKYYETDEEIAERLGLTDDDDETADGETARPDLPTAAAASQAAVVTGRPTVGGGGNTIIIGGGTAAAATAPAESESAQPIFAASASVAEEVAARHAGSMNVEAEQLAQIIRLANDELLRRAQAVLSPDMEEATRVYIEKMQLLNATLAQVEEQSRRLTRDSEEMENLNRALTGISTVYELQLKGVSSQVGTIDRINEQTRRMADQIEELNAVYARMIQALTVNMKAASANTDAQ